jgi:ADP-ribose pyrophosphatase YjhB (NUDIX family)
MSAQRIRPIAIAVVRHGDRILVEHGFDAVKREDFFRPPGGGIEFSEMAVDALRREFREELDAELAGPVLLGILENIFSFEGRPHHEIVFVFEARFEDSSLNERNEFFVKEGDARTRATWKTLEELRDADEPLYPEGLMPLLFVVS